MKRYIQPAIEVCKIAIHSVMQATSVIPEGVSGVPMDNTPGPSDAKKYDFIPFINSDDNVNNLQTE